MAGDPESLKAWAAEPDPEKTVPAGTVGGAPGLLEAAPENPRTRTLPLPAVRGAQMKMPAKFRGNTKGPGKGRGRGRGAKAKSWAKTKDED